jgi:hypothetical protein
MNLREIEKLCESAKTGPWDEDLVIYDILPDLIAKLREAKLVINQLYMNVNPFSDEGRRALIRAEEFRDTVTDEEVKP